jgi:hypothetical protein
MANELKNNPMVGVAGVCGGADTNSSDCGCMCQRECLGSCADCGGDSGNGDILGIFRQQKQEGLIDAER